MVTDLSKEPIKRGLPTYPKNESLNGVIKKGDLFFTTSPMLLGELINRLSGIQSPDRESEYSHCGVMVDPWHTVEALHRVESHIFLSYYEGHKVLIGRYNELTDMECDGALNEILKYMGQIYPYHRLLLHALGMAHFFHWKRKVCSEIVGKFAYHIGARHNKYFGTTPDMLADEVKNSLNRERTGPKYSIIYDGFLPINVYMVCKNCNQIVYVAETDSLFCADCCNPLSEHPSNYIQDLNKKARDKGEKLKKAYEKRNIK